jgi:large subunit ribosomal protein L9
MPQAILLQDVENVGAKGTVVDVSKGYLRNFLIPRKLAQPATKGLLEQARQATEAQARAQQQAAEAASKSADVLNRTVITISQQAGDDGRLFGSVTTQDIADAIKDARGLEIDRRKVHLDEPIRNVGTYQVVVEIGDGATATVKTIVVDNR